MPDPTSPTAIRCAAEAPDSPDARRCRAAYFAELARRFAGGFDHGAGEVSGDDDMRPPGGGFVVARLGAVPVGCGGFRRIGEGAAEIKRMWTAPEARGRGVAREVLRALERMAGERGYRVLRLDTNRALVEAQRFYRREGYREIACYNRNPYADLWFEKRPGSPREDDDA